MPLREALRLDYAFEPEKDAQGVCGECIRLQYPWSTNRIPGAFAGLRERHPCRINSTPRVEAAARSNLHLTHPSGAFAGLRERLPGPIPINPARRGRRALQN